MLQSCPYYIQSSIQLLLYFYLFNAFYHSQFIFQRYSITLNTFSVNLLRSHWGKKKKNSDTFHCLWDQFIDCFSGYLRLTKLLIGFKWLISVRACDILFVVIELESLICDSQGRWCYGYDIVSNLCKLVPLLSS